MSLTTRFAALSVASTLSLAGCGGGGGDTAPSSPSYVIASGSFPLYAGYVKRLQAGSTDNLVVSGDCQGTATLTVGKTVPAFFEGIAGYSATQVMTLALSNCNASTIPIQLPVVWAAAGNGVAYFDSNFTPIGSDSTGVEYSDVRRVPPPVPLETAMRVDTEASSFSVHWLDTDVYLDSTKTASPGTRSLTYLAYPATFADTATVFFYSQDYRYAVNHVVLNTTTQYRIARDGTLTLIDIDIDVEVVATGTLHLVFTKV